jgi:cytidylate kinase
MIAALATFARYVDEHPTRKEAPPLAIVITRQAGSRGTDIAQAVGARLGWPVFDRELLKRIAEEKGLSTRLLEHFDEHPPHWLEEVIAGFSTRYSPTEGAYVKQLLKLLASLGEVGHCVIVGRGAGHVLPAATTVHIRVVAPRAVRVAHIAKSKGLSPAEAERWVDQTDHDRTRFVKSNFNVDPNDPLEYDLILNSGRYTTEECADLIVQAMRVREAHMKAEAAHA